MIFHRVGTHPREGARYSHCPRGWVGARDGFLVDLGDLGGAA